MDSHKIYTKFETIVKTFAKSYQLLGIMGWIVDSIDSHNFKLAVIHFNWCNNSDTFQNIADCSLSWVALWKIYFIISVVSLSYSLLFFFPFLLLI